jgi:hypothetical protein
MAGLIVALAMVGLSKEATRTFHEEVRSSAAEGALRTAVDRLRADLQRARYMSTGNIQTDPMIAHAPGAANITTTAVGLKRLAGILLYEGGDALSTAQGLALSNQQTPHANVNPDMIDIGGNMTSTEQFEVQAIQPGAVGTCTKILLSATSPAIFRIMNNNTAGDAGAPSAGADAEMRNLFQPVGAGSSTQFIVRVVDDTARSQYLLTCKDQTNAAGLLTGGVLAPFVLVEGTPLMAKDTQGVSGLTGNSAGRAWVNPVQIVRWEIIGPAGTDGEPAQDTSALGGQSLEAGAQDAIKYDLMRSYVDVTSATGAVVPETREIVAEYAVDLDFAFSVDTSADTTGATPSIVTYDFGDGNNLTTADDVSKQPTAKPQRIRAVRARVVTRTAQADRTANVPATAPFLYRYCIAPGGCTGTALLQWARARTITTEVSIPNQSRDFY